MASSSDFRIFFLAPRGPSVAASLWAVGLLLVSAAVACEKDEAPPPLPSSEPVATAPEPTELKLAEEPDAGEEDAGKKTGTFTGGPRKSLMNCCNALMGNAKSAPEPQASQLKMAAGICTSLAKSGGNLSQIRSRLPPGVNVPGACM